MPVDDVTPLSPLIGPLFWVSSTVARFFQDSNASSVFTVSTRSLPKKEHISSGHTILPTMHRSFPSFLFWRSAKQRNGRITSSLSCSSRDSTVVPIHTTNTSSEDLSDVDTTTIVSNNDSSKVELTEVATDSNARQFMSSSVHLQLINPTLSPQPDQHFKDNTSSSNEVCNDAMDATSNNMTSTKSPTTSTVTVHTYHDASTNQTWKGLNISLRKFRAYLQYCNVWNNETSVQHGAVSLSYPATEPHIETVKHVVLSSSKQATSRSSIAERGKPSATTAGMSPSNVVNAEDKDTSELKIETARLRDEWRNYWKIGRLITDRTELLAVYPSDEQQESNNETDLRATSGKSNEGTENAPKKVSNSARKRGGFADLLLLYTDRLMAILNDERENGQISEFDSSVEPISMSSNPSTYEGIASQPSIDLVQWLKANYGRQQTMDLEFDSFQNFDESTKLEKLKHFLEWFRSQFPYFYDRCDACGASIKEDSTAGASSVSSETTTDEVNVLASDAKIDEGDMKDENVAGDDAAEENESDHQTFVGYIYPNNSELIGKASRTELYQCHKCFSFTRFPRYNTAKHILLQRRGRCGEYSMILFRFLRALNHECRWVVDWADHVWAELLLLPRGSSSSEATRWVHLDPCEAAVDENFIYQDWGKKQNFIIGFYLPPARRMQEALITMLSKNITSGTFVNASIPLIEDITSSYTREPWEDVCQRRDESESHIQFSVLKATHELQRKLLECYNYTSLTNEVGVVR